MFLNCPLINTLEALNKFNTHELSNDQTYTERITLFNRPLGPKNEQTSIHFCYVGNIKVNGLNIMVMN